MGRLGGRVGKIAEQMHVVERGEGARKVLLYEVESAPERLQANLYENARRILDVVAGCLYEAGRLAQLRQHAASAFGERRVREHDLRRQARAQRVGVELRAALPRSDLLQVEHARLDIGSHHRLLGFFDGRQIVLVDVLQAPGEPRQRTGVLLDGVPAEILYVVIVRMYPVERRASGMNFVEVGEIVVNEMMKWLGRTHHLGSSSNPSSVIANSDKPQWYNTLVGLETDTPPRSWPAACTSCPLPSGIWTT